MTDPTAHNPRRGSDIEAWIKAARDSWADDGVTRSGRVRPTRTVQWYVLDELLDDYRERADIGAALDAAAWTGEEAGK